MTDKEKLDAIKEIAFKMTKRKMSCYLSTKEMEFSNHKAICEICKIIMDTEE